MADIELNVSGDMEIPAQRQKGSFFNLPQTLHLSSPAAKEWIGQRRENVRPWATFINTKNFNVPPSLPRLSKRIRRNIDYFQSNYLFVFIGLIIYCLLTSPLLLLAVGVSLAIGYKISHKQSERKLAIFGHELTLAQQYGLVAICSVPLFLWAGAGAAVFWVIGASLMIIRSRATEMYTSYLQTVGLTVIGFILVLRTIVIDFLFFFCLYYIGASFFIITLHAAFYNIEAVVKTEDTYGLLQEV